GGAKGNGGVACGRTNHRERTNHFSPCRPGAVVYHPRHRRGSHVPGPVCTPHLGGPTYFPCSAYNRIFPSISTETEVMAQYVYTMNRVGKIVPPKRQILRDISLSFFPGAKIGVLGLNGAGKSTLLRIM